MKAETTRDLPPRFCVLPWVHLYVSPEGHVKGCSRWPSGPVYGNPGTPLEELWQGAAAEAVRGSMLKGAPPKGCDYCKTLEDAGTPSYRAQENARFPEAFEAREWEKGGKLAGGARPISVEFRFSNLCNLKCRTCGPRFSTAWRAEAEEVYGVEAAKAPEQAFPDHGRLLQLIDGIAPDLKIIQVLGGEPLLHDELYILMERLIELGRTDLTFRITTNFSKLKHGRWDFLELARQFKSVELSLSLDGVGEAYEILRKGGHWRDVERNFERASLLPNINFSIYPCVSVLNAFHLPDAIELFLELGMITPSRMLFHNFVTTEPVYYNIRVLDGEERGRLKLKYAEFLLGLAKKTDARIYSNVSSYLRGILSFLDGGSLVEHRAELARITELLDRRRGESFGRVFPEVKAWT